MKAAAIALGPAVLTARVSTKTAQAVDVRWGVGVRALPQCSAVVVEWQGWRCGGTAPPELTPEGLSGLRRALRHASDALLRSALAGKRPPVVRAPTRASGVPPRNVLAERQPLVVPRRTPASGAPLQSAVVEKWTRWPPAAAKTVPCRLAQTQQAQKQLAAQGAQAAPVR